MRRKGESACFFIAKRWKHLRRRGGQYENFSTRKGFRSGSVAIEMRTEETHREKGFATKRILVSHREFVEKNRSVFALRQGGFAKKIENRGGSSPRNRGKGVTKRVVKGLPPFESLRGTSRFWRCECGPVGKREKRGFWHKEVSEGCQLPEGTTEKKKGGERPQAREEILGELELNRRPYRGSPRVMERRKTGHRGKLKRLGQGVK